MKKMLLPLIVAAALATGAMIERSGSGAEQAAAGPAGDTGQAYLPARPESQGWVAAPGRVEPVSEEMRLAFDLSGRIEAVLVEEGDVVQAGQPLARLQSADYAQRVAEAEAQVRLRDSELLQLQNGSRTQERLEALASVNEAKASLNNARTEYERRLRLHLGGVISKEEADRSEKDYLTARARLEALRQRHALVENQTRPEELARAQAALELSRAQLGESRTLLDKTTLVSPIDGVVLKKHRREGETVSINYDSPIVTVGDISVLCVRAEVDERDIAHVRLGQRAFVTADAFGNRRFPGAVIRIGKALGRKNIKTDEPAERVDTKILEVLIRMDEPGGLVTGLRVDAFILKDG